MYFVLATACIPAPVLVGCDTNLFLFLTARRHQKAGSHRRWQKEAPCFFLRVCWAFLDHDDPQYPPGGVLHVVLIARGFVYLREKTRLNRLVGSQPWRDRPCPIFSSSPGKM